MLPLIAVDGSKIVHRVVRSVYNLSSLRSASPSTSGGGKMDIKMKLIKCFYHLKHNIYIREDTFDCSLAKQPNVIIPSIHT